MPGRLRPLASETEVSRTPPLPLGVVTPRTFPPTGLWTPALPWLFMAQPVKPLVVCGTTGKALAAYGATVKPLVARGATGKAGLVFQPVRAEGASAKA